MKADGAPRIAVVTANANASNSYTLDWLDAFLESPMLEGTHIDLYRPGASNRLRKELREVDATVVLHSATADDLQPLNNVRHIFKDRRGPLCMLVGNEINLPWAPLSQKIALMQDVSVDIIGTQLLEEAGRVLYASVEGAQVVSLPHAANTNRLAYTRPKANEPRRIGTRSARYLPILGDTDREDFFDSVNSVSTDRGWLVDISEARLERAAWHEYLAELDVAIGTEAGSWFTAPSDDVVISILNEAREARSGINIAVDGKVRRLTRRLPWQLRQWLRTGPVSRAISNDLELLEHLDAASILKRYFVELPRPTAYMKALSSRHVEAAALGVPQLLLRGRYNDILVADQDYVAANTDLGNVRDAIERLECPSVRTAVSESARERILGGHTLEHRVASILGHLGAAK
jgi:hypothetical protein